MRFRQSFINDWMSCPLKAKFRHVDNLPDISNAAAEFGTAVHSAMEVLVHTRDTDKARNHFLSEWSQAKPDVWPKYTSFAKYKETGIKMIESYAEIIRWQDMEVVATEHRFLVPFGKHELEGTVDRVDLLRKELRISDYKTSGFKPTALELQYRIQFTAYIYASMQPEFWFGNGEGFPPVPNAEYWWDRTKDLKRRAIWIHLRAPKEINAGHRTDKDFMRLYRACNEIESATLQNVFVPDISASTCSICPYTSPCGIEVPSAD